MKLVYWSKLMTEAAIINFPETGQTCVFGGVTGLLPSAVHHSDSTDLGIWVKDVFKVTSGDGRVVSGVPKRKPPHIDLI